MNEFFFHFSSNDSIWRTGGDISEAVQRPGNDASTSSLSQQWMEVASKSNVIWEIDSVISQSPEKHRAISNVRVDQICSFRVTSMGRTWSKIEE